MSSVKFISWNVNGLRACRKKGFDSFLHHYSPDFLCLQEVKLSPEVVPDEDFGYSFRRYHLAEKKGYSGVAVFSKEEPMSVAIDFAGDDPHPDEGRVLTCEYDGFYLVNVYVPNAKGDLSRLRYRHEFWDPSLRKHLCELRKNKPVVLCGDLNVAHREIDLANPKSNRRNAGFTDEEREGIGHLLDAGFLDTFRHLNPDVEGAFSWWSYRAGARERNVGWRIDYFLASDDLATSIRDAYILADVHGSDHCPVALELARG